MARETYDRRHVAAILSEVQSPVENYRRLQGPIMASRMTARRFIGNEIRRAREAKEMSRAAVSKAVVVSESLVAAWESGRQAIKADYMTKLIGVLEFDPEIVVRMVIELVDGEALPEWEDKWKAAETKASSMWSFEVFVIPGLLQTPEYVGAVLSDEDLVKERLERQKILTSETRPQLVALMSEAVLRLNVGGAETMAAQLDYLAECATRDNIIVQIIPMDSEVCGKFRVPFMVATLEDGTEVAYTDSPITGEVIEGVEELATLRQLFDKFRGHAYPIQQSIDLVRRVAEQWKT
jgi:transcriptional regulator with XRE-family HTH domain